MPSNSKLGSGLDAIFGSDINSLLDDIQNGNEPEGVTTSNTNLRLSGLETNISGIKWDIHSVTVLVRGGKIVLYRQEVIICQITASWEADLMRSSDLI